MVCKNRCPAVDLSKFLSQNKSRVGKVYKNRCPAVDLATFYQLSKSFKRRGLVVGEFSQLKCYFTPSLRGIR